MYINQFGNTHRYFCLFSVLFKSHYDALGLTPKATQGEIKAAYYKLSMIYHPDKNKGSESANEKFKAITAAYEVLGNFKLRRLYDRGSVIDDGHLKGWGSQESKDSSVKGARIQTTRGTYTGRTPIYDFDEWSRIHYGEILEKRAKAKARYEKQFGSNNENRLMIERESVMFSLLLFLCSSFIIFTYAYRFNSLDSPPEKLNDKK